jgi:acyl carrier protein
MQGDENREIAKALARLTTKDLSAGDIQGEMSLNGDLGIDSLQFILLLLEIESKAERKIFDVESISQIKTVGDLCSAVAER